MLKASTEGVYFSLLYVRRENGEFLILSKCNAALFLNTHREWNAVEFNNTADSRVECFFVISLHNAFYDKRYDEVLGNHI